LDDEEDGRAFEGGCEMRGWKLEEPNRRGGGIEVSRAVLGLVILVINVS
jgi:hypothetical protein